VNKLSKAEYRKDIDGLRALAVLSVIIFHMNPGWLPGGFIGVDVFFVISGYLITKIIHREITEGSFSFLNFYNRRIKRILPVFFTVIAVCLIVGYFILLPYDYIRLGRSSFSTLAFASNIYFPASSGGYFGGTSTLPLLHSWSLAVEEQYYFIWPITLILLLKIIPSSKNLIYILVAIASVSFIGATLVALSDSMLTRWNYYLLPSRAGELLVGSILAILINNGKELRTSSNWSAVGLVAIFASFFFVSKNSLFPGINALWACLGVAFIIYSNPVNPINRALSIKPLVYVGLLSYSLYLWHWPVLAFIRYITPDNQAAQTLSNTQILTAALLTWLLSHLSYTLIETKTRRLKLSPQKTFSLYFIAPSISIGIISIALFTSDGAPSRFGDNTVAKLQHHSESTCHKEGDDGCLLSDGSKNLRIALAGDSHGQSMEKFFQDFGIENDIKVYGYTSSACPPARPLERVYEMAHWRGKRCEQTRNRFDLEADKADAVFLVGRWENNFFDTYDNAIRLKQGAVDDYYQKLKAEIIRIKESGAGKVILVNQVPKYLQDVKKLLLPFTNKQVEIDELYIKANNQIQKLATETDVFVVDFTPIFCQNNDCSPLSENGETLYFDDDHLNLYGSSWLFDKYKHSANYDALMGYLNN